MFTDIKVLWHLLKLLQKVGIVNLCGPSISVQHFIHLVAALPRPVGKHLVLLSSAAFTTEAYFVPL